MAKPSWCTVPGCSFYRTSRATGNAFHRYPLKDPERCKRWVIAVRHIKYDVKTPAATLNGLRVCSKHFREDDYERDFKAEIMGTKNKRRLKDTAVPSVFPWTGPAVHKYRGAFEKRKRAEVLASIEGLNRTSKSNQPTKTAISSARYEVGGTVSQPLLDREQLLDDTGSVTVEITEELFGSDHDDDVATAPDGEEEFLSSEEEPEEPKKMRKNKKGSSDEWEPSDKEDTVLTDYSSDSSEDLENVGSSDLTEVAKAATSQTDRQEDGKLVVWWCDECGAEPEVTCTTRRHKMLYACAVCVGQSEQAVGFDQFYMRFDDLSSLKNHVQLEHNTKVCQRTLCPDCGRYHFKKDHLCEHKIKKFPCLDCGKLLVSQISLKLHSRIHQDSFMHVCKFCLKKFKTKAGKQTHEESHPQENCPYQCPDCSERFSTFKKRNRHHQSCRVPSRYVCDVCGQELNGLHALNRHKMVHTGQKPFKCKLCQMSFNQDSHLKSHTRLHTGERPFKCQQCEKCFNHNVSLKNHVHRHHGPDCQEQRGREKEQGERSSPKEQGEGQELIHQPEQERDKREPRMRRHKSCQRQTSDPEGFEEEGVRQINSDSDFNPAEEKTTSRGRGRPKGRLRGRPSTKGKRNVAVEALD